jgi:hypothetical protein
MRRIVVTSPPVVWLGVLYRALGRGVFRISLIRAIYRTEQERAGETFQLAEGIARLKERRRLFGWWGRKAIQAERQAQYLHHAPRPSGVGPRLAGIWTRKQTIETRLQDFRERLQGLQARVEAINRFYESLKTRMDSVRGAQDTSMLSATSTRPTAEEIRE